MDLGLLLPIIDAIARILKISRQQFADSLEDMVKDIRAGKLIPDEAFSQAESDLNKLNSIVDDLPE